MNILLFITDKCIFFLNKVIVIGNMHLYVFFIIPGHQEAIDYEIPPMHTKNPGIPKIIDRI